MSIKQCPGCGTKYRTIQEIKNAGGHVYQVGLALKAVCECGHKLGSVQKLFSVSERFENAG
jgi:hypothetical protein